MQTTLAINPEFQSFDPRNALQSIKDQGDWVGLRFYQEKNHQRTIRNLFVEQAEISIERGVMVEVVANGQLAYSGTSDLSPQGIKKAAQVARSLALAGAGRKIFNFEERLRPKSVGQFLSPRKITLDKMALAEFTDKQVQACQHLKISDAIINAEVGSMFVETEIEYLTTSGTHTQQSFLMISHGFSATAKNGTENQKRSLNGFRSVTRQSGLEIFDWEQIFSDCQRIASQAIDLSVAENCPTGNRDLLIHPDQMYMQIHESIGHPLELDRILGDERNYAGWSFVKPSDFGQLQYGSKLMNVTFDPTVSGEFASYAFDDSGNPATREYLIKDGLLLKGLGSLESQSRMQVPGVSNFRSASWNRAPIDRMANINLEPGTQSLQDIISQTEKGIFVESNLSWSIDDYRNKFQFGCEYGRLIENGKLTKVVKNPNYRGVTVPFWNNLKAVGRKEDMQIFGSPYCGKGEPSQVIRVGHASPPCLFSNIEVFGGGQ